ncbi:hypothetical protein LCGC14_1396550 [marine sediment metagenome]|uniref:Uncharacterized protein n=1 Tax=marine sediment metagenome TaxID=412755 RepID=A0A0F9MDY9_9ZZZZ
MKDEINDSTKEENLKAFEKLLDEKESLDDTDLGRYRYYEDMYGNQYRWTTHRQKDGKFHATLKKANTTRRRGWLFYETKKEKAFVKRKTAKSWCLKYVQKAKEHQAIVINAREARKQARLDAMPKFTKKETAIKEAEKKIQHLKKLQAKSDSKIKALITRKRTHQKKIKYHEKRISHTLV